MRRRRLLTFAALAAALSPARHVLAQREDDVRRGDMRVIVKTQGTVVVEDVFRLKSTINGRVEAVLASSASWAGPEGPIALIADTELAALMDAKQTTPEEVLEERWQKVFRPTKVSCPVDCFLLQVYARSKKWVKPQAVLFEAAKTLRLVGRIRPEDGRWIKEGQDLVFWPVSQPGFKQHAAVHNFVLDIQGRKVDPGGTFTALLERGRSLKPGTQWQGTIEVLVKKNVLKVPTDAIIDHDGSMFLAVRISTGITAQGETEIAAGVEEKRRYLILDPKDLRSARPYAPKLPPVEAPRLPVDDELDKRDPPPGDED